MEWPNYIQLKISKQKGEIASEECEKGQEFFIIKAVIWTTIDNHGIEEK